MHPFVVLVDRQSSRLMLKKYEQLFAYLKTPEPPAGLFDRTMRRIRKEQRLLAIKWRLAIFSVASLISLVALIPTFKMAQTGLNESGFIQFFSLLLSDSGVVITYWQSFVLALLESLPAVSLALFLAAVFASLESVKLLIQNIKIIFTPLNSY
jgi:ABC-type spermidine/putrescine transport system permease subunit I